MPRPRIEHRREPRYRYPLQVRVGGARLMTANVSLHGMQLVCPMGRFAGIETAIRAGALNAQITVLGDASIDATGSVRYVSHHGDEVLIGVRLSFTDPGAQANWAACVREVSARVPKQGA